jgi:hypothetical protein
MIPTAQQVSELLDSQTIRWFSQDQVNSDAMFGYHEVGPLTDALNEAFCEATHQNLIAGIGQMSVTHPTSSPLFREVQALATQTLLSMCAITHGDESDGSLPDLVSVDAMSSDSDTSFSDQPDLYHSRLNADGHADSSMLPPWCFNLDVTPTMDYADAYLYFPEHDQAPPYLEPGDLGYSSTDDYS